MRPNMMRRREWQDPRPSEACSRPGGSAFSIHMDCPPPSVGMDRSGAKSRASSRRQPPLNDSVARVNANTHSPRSTKTATPLSAQSSGTLPHHESIAARGALTVQNATSPRSKHESLIVDEEEADDKRNSQLSTVSTNASSSKGVKRKTRIGPWQLGANIGGGSVGTVRKVRHVVTGQVAAAKVISKNTADLSRAESMAHFPQNLKGLKGDGVTLPVGIEREVVIMKLLEHPNIVRLYDVWENRSQLYIIMEYVEGGELFDYVREGPLEEDEAVWIFRQICAALLHAHQFRIYHRDLKPENILLSHQLDQETGRVNPQIKLVDFGMAALQPRGKNLISPCGSVHYAAPEIFKKNYDGAKADVWSLGIIVYIMLVGTIPFAWNSLDQSNYFVEWYNQITKGKIDVPTHLSPEARDLIKRMLVVNPQQRISLQHVWSHPLLKKWSVAWQESPKERALESWIGMAQSIGNLPLGSKADIDREVLRNLRVLWHSESEDCLVKRLLNIDKNLEKYFYHALIRHREDQQENFIGLPEELSYSTSDYHHLQPVLHPSEVPPIPKSAFERTKSNFSILNDDDPKTSRSNSTKPGESERSYDPFRSSKPALVEDKSKGCTVTVHRRPSLYSRKNSAGLSSKGAPSLRVEALKNQQQRLSTSSGHLAVRSSPTGKPTSRRSMSRSSMGSSLCSSSPSHSIVVRPSDRHRRGIDFSQRRKSSTMNNLTTDRIQSDSTLDTPPKYRGKIVAPDDSIVESIETDNAVAIEELVAKSAASRRDAIFGDPKLARIRRAATHSQVIETEARKVSTELETLCEAAFNRDSAASSSVTSGGNPDGSYETPPSSISNRGSTHSAQAIAAAMAAEQDYRSSATRSFSEGAHETPNTYITRELQEARKKIAGRYARDESAQSNPNYREVLAQIDAFLDSSKTARGGVAPQVPESRSGEHLPVISEKNSLEEPLASRPGQGPAAQELTRIAPSSSQQSDIQATVRLIDKSSPQRPAPLNVRKSSTVSSHASTTPSTPTPLPMAAKMERRLDGRQPMKITKPAPVVGSHRSVTLGAITEESAARDARMTTVNAVPKKRRKWYKIWDDDGQKAAAARNDKDSGEFESKGRKRVSNDSSLPGSPKVAVPGKRPGFLSFLGKRKTSKHAGFHDALLREDSSPEASTTGNDNSSTVTSYTRKPPPGMYRQQANTGTRNMAGAETQETDPRDLGVQQTWLARFFHIKPASAVLCFDASRGRARQVLVRILRSWRMYGIRDVVLDREKNLIFGSFAADNYLRYKPMDFVIEMFVVLEYGFRANLSLARITQRKGAASTFHKLVATLEEVLTDKSLLMQDDKRKYDMEGILRG